MAVTRDHPRPLRARYVWAGFLVVMGVAILVVRFGTFSTLPSWDSAMTIWPAAIEMSERGSISEVMDLPGYSTGGPNSHMLSAVTLVTAALVSVGGGSYAIAALLILNSLMLLGVGYMVARTVARLTSRTLGWLAGGATVLFPLMVAQSAILYTELPSAFFVLIALVLAADDRFGRAILAVTAAIWIKPLALVAIPAIAVFEWRRGRSLKKVSVAALALLGLIPAVVVPQPPPQAEGFWSKVSLATERSWLFIRQSPELVLMGSIPFISYVVLRRRGATEKEWDWHWAVSTLYASFVGFFVLNVLVTPGHFFIPRYFAMLVPPLMVLLAVSVSKVRRGIQIGMFATIIALSLVGVRGENAWGINSPLEPVAERSLAFVVRLEEHIVGLERLAVISQEIPVFYGHLAHYSYTYPELGHFSGEIVGGQTTSTIDGWGDDLDELPDQFAMLIGFPYLGGDDMRSVQRRATASADYSVSIEGIGEALLFPLEIVIVRRLDP